MQELQGCRCANAVSENRIAPPRARRARPMSGAKLETNKVWRYMSFARFVWLLQKKQLWLARADLLGDPWEITLTGNQLAHVVSNHPITPLPEVERESALERSERIIKLWRSQTFVNCWSLSEHESHALWRIYCRSNEGIAIQTTIGRLSESVGGLSLYHVTYAPPVSAGELPLCLIWFRKSAMFAYEPGSSNRLRL